MSNAIRFITLATLAMSGCVPTHGLSSSFRPPDPTPFPTIASPSPGVIAPAAQPALPAATTGLLRLAGRAELGGAAFAGAGWAAIAGSGLTGITDADGRFALDVAPGTLVRLRFTSGAQALDALEPVGDLAPVATTVDETSTALAPLAASLVAIAGSVMPEGARAKAQAAAVAAVMASRDALRAQLAAQPSLAAAFVRAGATDVQQGEALLAALGTVAGREVALAGLLAIHPHVAVATGQPAAYPLPGLGLEVRWTPATGMVFLHNAETGMNASPLEAKAKGVLAPAVR